MRQAVAAFAPFVEGRAGWLLASDIPMAPLLSVSSIERLDESLEAVDLQLTPEQRAALDEAH